MSDSREMLTMRAMAWERSKGELRAYLHTYWSNYKTDGKLMENGFDEADERICKFIKDFEDNCR